MNDENLTITFTVDQTPEEAFAAINNVRGWWSGEIEGNTDKLGDEFTYRSLPKHAKRLFCLESTPLSAACCNFTQDKAEWTGTDITFDISRMGDKTEVRFTHAGLVPEYECFDSCSSAWGFYINSRLRSLIAARKG